MIVDEFDVVSVVVFPAKTEPPLAIDANDRSMLLQHGVAASLRAPQRRDEVDAFPGRVAGKDCGRAFVGEGDNQPAKPA